MGSSNNGESDSPKLAVPGPLSRCRGTSRSIGPAERSRYRRTLKSRRLTKADREPWQSRSAPTIWVVPAPAKAAVSLSHRKSPVDVKHVSRDEAGRRGSQVDHASGYFHGLSHSA